MKHLGLGLVFLSALWVLGCNKPGGFYERCETADDCKEGFVCRSINSGESFCSRTCGGSTFCETEFNSDAYCAIAGICLQDCGPGFRSCPGDARCISDDYCNVDN